MKPINTEALVSRARTHSFHDHQAHPDVGPGMVTGSTAPNGLEFAWVDPMWLVAASAATHSHWPDRSVNPTR
jgi:hypothetical protein